MNIGDLVSARACKSKNCYCFLCMHKSSRIGIITEAWTGEDDEICYFVEFDAGEWPIYGNGVSRLLLDCISESEHSYEDKTL